MKKDIRKRLERALITLQEPGGSTIRSIIKVINKESPILSLRKVLEALQEGINEGFLCMYNGRFKLKQQINTAKMCKDTKCVDSDDNVVEIDSNDVLKTSDVELSQEDSEFSSDDESINIEKEGLTTLKKNYNNKKNLLRDKKKFQSLPKGKNKAATSQKKSARYGKPGGNNRHKSKYQDKMANEKLSHKIRPKDAQDNMYYDSLLEDEMTYRESKMLNRSPVEKPDIRKQRGPRCTSMKKDVRMPSKVQIPFVPPAVPQRSSIINELLRRSPEPVHGPLYDSYNEFAFKPDSIEYFGAYS